MKRSTLHEIIGVLVTAGRDDLAQEIVGIDGSQLISILRKLCAISNNIWEKKLGNRGVGDWSAQRNSYLQLMRNNPKAVSLRKQFRSLAHAKNMGPVLDDLAHRYRVDLIFPTRYFIANG